MTQIESARKGTITPEMHYVAKREDLDAGDVENQSAVHGRHVQDPNHVSPEPLNLLRQSIYLGLNGVGSLAERAFTLDVETAENAGQRSLSGDVSGFDDLPAAWSQGNSPQTPGAE